MPDLNAEAVFSIEYTTLENSDLRVSRLCMGGCPMGCYGWGDVSEPQLINAVHAALENGINFFDTADTYGLGKSEEILGKALRGKRDKAVIATKFGVRMKNGRTFWDNSSDWINVAVHESLKRLGTDYIDLYQIHNRDASTGMDEVMDSLEALKKKGYVRYFGLSNIHREDLTVLAPYIGRFVSMQDEYSLACRSHEEDLTVLAEQLRLTPLTWGSLGQGVLTGKYDIDAKFSAYDRRSKEIYVNFHGEKLKKNLKIVDILRDIASQTGKSVPAVAIRFILDYLKKSVVLVGIKKREQILSNIEAVGWSLSDPQIGRLLAVSDR